MHDTPYEAGRGEAALSQLERTRPSLHQLADTINVRIEQLEKLRGGFTDRLEPVLAPSRPQPVREGVPDRSDDGSWLFDYLNGTARRLDDLIDGYSSLLTRVEL